MPAKKKAASKKATKKKAPVKKATKKKATAKKAAPKKTTNQSKSKPANKSNVDIEKFRKILIELRLRISGELNHLESDTLNRSHRDSSGDLSGYSFHQADAATDNFDLETTLGLASNEQNILNLVDDAIHKLDDGSYGICDICKKKIPVKRLLVMPYAPNCIQCQEQEEKEQKLG
jgi:RNA polymerase-binding transcription factor DksA